LEQWKMQEIYDEVPQGLPNCAQYYMEIDESEAEEEGEQCEDLQDQDDMEALDGDDAAVTAAFSDLL